MLMRYQVVSGRVRPAGELRQRRGKTPPLANCGVIVQRYGNRSDKAGSTGLPPWMAATRSRLPADRATEVEGLC